MTGAAPCDYSLAAAPFFARPLRNQVGQLICLPVAWKPQLLAWVSCSRSSSAAASTTASARSFFDIDQASQDWMNEMAKGDARQAITMLENTAGLYSGITVENLKNALQ